MSDCDDTVKTITCKGLADDIHVDVVQDHDPMSSHFPYYPVLNCSSDAHISFDDASGLLEYFYNDGVFCSPLVNTSLSNELLCCQHHVEAMSTESIYLLHEFTNSALDVVIQYVGLNLSYIYDCLLSIGSTDETPNLDIKSESVLSFHVLIKLNVLCMIHLCLDCFLIAICPWMLMLLFLPILSLSLRPWVFHGLCL